VEPAAEAPQLAHAVLVRRRCAVDLPRPAHETARAPILRPAPLVVSHDEPPPVRRRPGMGRRPSLELVHGAPPGRLQTWARTVVSRTSCTCRQPRVTILSLACAPVIDSHRPALLPRAGRQSLIAIEDAVDTHLGRDDVAALAVDQLRVCIAAAARRCTTRYPCASAIE
jgi:hypothetical protein